MGGMKRPGLIIIVMSCILMSSCSWAKHRYQWVKDHLPKVSQQASGSTRKASLVSIQPTRAQQAEARRLLSSLPPEQRSAGAAPQLSEQEFTRQLMVQEGAAAPADSATGYEQPGQLPPAAAVQPYSPAAGAVANPYANVRFVPRDAALPEDTDPTYTAPPQPDAAQLRGLRSPALPQALPMDIDGKLRSPSTR